MKTRGWRTCTSSYQGRWRGAESWHLCTMLSRDQCPLWHLGAPSPSFGVTTCHFVRLSLEADGEKATVRAQRRAHCTGCSAGSLGVTHHTGPTGHSQTSVPGLMMEVTTWNAKNDGRKQTTAQSPAAALFSELVQTVSPFRCMRAGVWHIDTARKFLKLNWEVKEPCFYLFETELQNFIFLTRLFHDSVCN